MGLPSKGYFGGSKYNYGGSVVEFNATPFINVVMQNVEERLDQCGELFVERARANFVFMAPPPSMPWDFPHIDPREIFEMRDYIKHTVFNRGGAAVMQAGIIDENLPGRLGIYPGMLETGTSIMAPRPWMTITMDEVWFDWQKILTGMGPL